MMIEFGNSYYKHKFMNKKKLLHQLPIGVLANKLQYCISYCKIYKKDVIIAKMSMSTN